MNFFKNATEIIYLGPGGSYTEMAKDLFCQKYDIKCYQRPLQSIYQAIHEVDFGQNTLGVIPIENSIEGAVRESLDNLIKTNNPNLKILSEIVMPISHCLLAKTTEISSISSIISHPQAIAQCLKFINSELPMNLNVIHTGSTAEAASSLDRYNLTYAAIGSEKTAELYNLNILKSDINDDKSNQTRFALIGDFEVEPSENDKTSIAFSTVNNKPGALLDVLLAFRNRNINLSYIESRPSKHKFGEYTFFTDFEGNIKDKNVAETIEEIKSQTTFYRFMGSYERNIATSTHSLD